MNNMNEARGVLYLGLENMEPKNGGKEDIGDKITGYVNAG